MIGKDELFQIQCDIAIDFFIHFKAFLSLLSVLIQYLWINKIIHFLIFFIHILTVLCIFFYVFVNILNWHIIFVNNSVDK
jgi:hypothetical protein